MEIDDGKSLIIRVLILVATVRLCTEDRSPTSRVCAAKNDGISLFSNRGRGRFFCANREETSTSNKNGVYSTYPRSGNAVHGRMS